MELEGVGSGRVGSDSELSRSGSWGGSRSQGPRTGTLLMTSADHPVSQSSAPEPLTKGPELLADFALRERDKT
jgi:hypothetical protein